MTHIDPLYKVFNAGLGSIFTVWYEYLSKGSKYFFHHCGLV